MTQLIIARHGNTFDPGDTVRRVGARTDLALSSSGRAQAERLGRHLAEMDRPPGVIYAAPLKRALETAHIVSEVLGLEAAPKPLEFLTEIDYGTDEGARETDVVARLGEEALVAWDRDAIVPPGWHVDVDALKAGWVRTFKALARVHPEGRVLLVTSNGVARFALQVMSPAHTDGPIKLKTGAYGLVDLDSEGAGRCLGWNIQPSSAP